MTRSPFTLIFWLSCVLLPLFAACSLPVTDETGRQFFVSALQDYWREEYAAYQTGRPSRNAPPGVARAVGEQASSWFLAAFRLERTALPTLPEPVRVAHDYYFQAVEANDWGNVHLYGVKLAGQPIYAVRVTTDGDDGWLELFDESGRLLGAGRTYIELVVWGDQAVIRGQVFNGEFPPALADRVERTLWGK